jgi:predicted anti-sigma-YlaC factor YlaD
MISYNITGKCETTRKKMDFYLNRNVPDLEIGGHLKICTACRAEWKARLSLKKKIKQAVSRDDSPPRLFEAIRRRIHEQSSKNL